MKTRKLYHYSTQEHVPNEVEDVWQYDKLKPCGLWLSDCDNDYGWKQWTIAENFCELKGIQARSVVVLDMASILHLGNHAELLKFSRQHYKHGSSGFENMFQTIDWKHVAAIYKGILITPHLWDSRYKIETLWYSTWDCASGCVWDSTAVVSIEQDHYYTAPKMENVA